MIPAAKLERLLDRFSAIESEMASGASGAAFVKLSREHAELGPVIETAREYRSVQTQLEETEALIADPATDPEMRGMAEQERADLRARIAVLDRDLKIQLLPRDAADASSAIVEIRAGTGGDEAALFAGDLLSMYQRYCGQQGWKTEVLSLSESELGGYKDATLEVEGRGVYAKLKFESGVHRVQRVPATETQGRIHTSAATVAVLPEAEDVDIVIHDKDLRIDTYRAQGAGGQHVNKTDSAVRITHVPSGLVVECQTERSQHANRDKAMQRLKSALHEQQVAAQQAATAASRRLQVGSGDRSARIRTWNFPQGRVTDHRVEGLTLYALPQILEGDLDPLLARLAEEDRADALKALADGA